MGRPKKEQKVNERVPKAGTEFPMDVSHAAEMAACIDELSGIFHFLDNYFYTQSLDEGIIKINLHVVQRQLIRLMINPRSRFNIILASRQVGKTTMMAIVALWFMLFNENFKVLLLANKEETAIDILRKIQMLYEKLPPWLKSGSVEYSKTKMVFANGSEISISTTTSDAGRGKTIHLLLLDEFAFVENSEDFYTSVFPVISSSKKSRIIISSTPHGTNNMFYKLVKECEEGNSVYSLFKIHWSEIPGRTEKWAERTKKGIGSEELWQQEYECVASDALVDVENMGCMTIEDVFNTL